MRCSLPVSLPFVALLGCVCMSRDDDQHQCKTTTAVLSSGHREQGESGVCWSGWGCECDGTVGGSGVVSARRPHLPMNEGVTTPFYRRRRRRCI